MKLKLVATATFGLEAVVRREIEALGYKVLKTEDGRVTYLGDERAVVRSNLWLRSADRVYIRMGEFSAVTFEELFQQTRAIAWEEIIPLEGNFPVVGGSVKSALHSVPACQSIIKKAVVSRLSEFYCRDIMPETGAEYRIRFIAHKDVFLLLIDTSGAGLHKRGYRVRDVAAPMKETLAAALVQLSFYRKDRVLVDTCCGSGTIPIEAAMIARNIAPGLSRDFASMKWDLIPQNIWKEEKKLAYEAADFDTVLFGDRFPFRYLVDDYGLNYYAAFVGCSAETEASFETVVFLANKLDELSLPAVLQIETADGKIARTIVANTQAKDQQILTMDSMQSTTAKDVAAGASCLAIMEKNLDVLKAALG